MCLILLELRRIINLGCAARVFASAVLDWLPFARALLKLSAPSLAEMSVAVNVYPLFLRCKSASLELSAILHKKFPVIDVKLLLPSVEFIISICFQYQNSERRGVTSARLPAVPH